MRRQISEQIQCVGGKPFCRKPGDFHTLRKIMIDEATRDSKEFDELIAILYAVQNKVWEPIEFNFGLEEEEEEEPPEAEGWFTMKWI